MLAEALKCDSRHLRPFAGHLRAIRGTSAPSAAALPSPSQHHGPYPARCSVKRDARSTPVTGSARRTWFARRIAAPSGAGVAAARKRGGGDAVAPGRAFSPMLPHWPAVCHKPSQPRAPHGVPERRRSFPAASGRLAPAEIVAIVGSTRSREPACANGDASQTRGARSHVWLRESD